MQTHVKARPYSRPLPRILLLFLILLLGRMLVSKTSTEFQTKYERFFLLVDFSCKASNMIFRRKREDLLIFEVV